MTQTLNYGKHAESETTIKVWLTRRMSLCNQFEGTYKSFEAGSCFMLNGDQSLARDGYAVIYGAGCYDVVPLDAIEFKRFSQELISNPD